MIRFDDEIERLMEAVIGAAIAVHRELGPGHQESVYENALVVELLARELRVERQVTGAVHYRDKRVGEYRIDVLVEGRLVVELKAVESLHPVHYAQVVSYLKLRGERVGLLLNFNVTLLKDQGIKRVIFTR